MKGSVRAWYGEGSSGPFREILGLVITAAKKRWKAASSSSVRVKYEVLRGEGCWSGRSAVFRFKSFGIFNHCLYVPKRFARRLQKYCWGGICGLGDTLQPGNTGEGPVVWEVPSESSFSWS